MLIPESDSDSVDVHLLMLSMLVVYNSSYIQLGSIQGGKGQVASI